MPRSDASHGVPPQLPAGFRFASGSVKAGVSPRAVEEQLRRRLRFVAAVFVALAGAFVLLNAFRLVAGSVTVGSNALSRVIGAMAVASVLQGWVCWRLRPAAPTNLPLLRRVELSLVGLMIVVGGVVHWNDFPTIVALLPISPIDLGLGYAMFDVLGIVAYGLLIPNTWRRCLAIVLALLVASLLVDAANLARFDLPLQTWAPFVGMKLISTAAMASLSVFGAYRIERSEGAAREASRLGQYVVREKLGAGGMGEVYRAEHQYLRRPCAVKIIRAEQAGNADVLQRFEREVQATAALTHPNTVAIYDYGIADDGTFYYVMEYLPGLTLEQLIDQDGPLTAARAVHVMLQLTGALHEAHDAGLTHRDIKPGNVMLCERGGVADVAKLLDFGLVASHAAVGGDDRLTQAGMLLGSPAFMSPEQCNGDEAVGPSSDIYSLGALLCFLLSGEAPFQRRAPLQTMMAHLSETPLPPSARRTGIAPALDEIVMRCLAKPPSARYASVRDLATALAAV